MGAQYATPQVEGNLLHNLVLFGRLLRGLGMDVNPGRVLDLFEALQFIDIGNKTDFYFSARALFVHHRADIPLFDQAFELFWRRPRERWYEVDLRGSPGNRRLDRSRPVIVPPPLPGRGPQPLASDEDSLPEGPPLVQLTLTYSDREILRQKDFSELTAAEMDALKRTIATLSWQLGFRRSRRQKAGKGEFLDMRRTMRKNIRYGGEIYRWSFRRPKKKPRPLVVIADVSGSMERYTRLLLHFIYSLSEAHTRRVESFLFSSHLTRISHQLKDRDIDRALTKVSGVVTDWAGGTRTGQSLKSFNFEWGRRVLSGGAVVLLISDEWDRGDIDLLTREMARLQRNCHRIIWLNPLLGSPDYEPLTRGMQACLPYIDDFLPVHNLASLEDLAARLAQLN